MKRIAVLSGLLFSLVIWIAGAESLPPPDSRCSLSASSTQFDYGMQTRWQLRTVPGTALLSPGERALTVTAACPYSQVLRLKLQGEMSPHGRLRYGEQGELRVRVTAAQLDGQPVGLTLGRPGNKDAVAVTLPVTLEPDSELTAGEPGQLLTGRTLSLQLTLTPLLSEQDTRVITRTQNESGLTFTLLD
jgi:hypothetical protein